MSIIRKEQLSNPLSASYAATASIATSASFATTASFASNTSINTSSFVTTSSFNAFTASINSFTSSINAFTASYNTGSFTGSFTGSLIGTSSWAISASQAISSSYYKETDPVFTAVSGTFVTTSSFNNFTSSYNTGSFTGSFIGTASYASNANSASYALSSSYAATSSNILGGKAPHIPYFITDTSLATSSIYQSGSTTVIINQDNATTANPEALYVWQPSSTSFNVISGKGNLNNYLQLNIQNTNQGTNASSDVVATSDNGNESINYIDMGINGENFTGDIGGPNDAYLYSTGQSLHIGNATANQPIQFFAGGIDVEANKKLELNADGQHNITGSLEISGGLAVKGITSVNQANVVTIDTVTGQFYYTASSAFGGGGSGVTQILTGSGITISPTNGIGVVTISATGGGGGDFVTTSSFNNYTGSSSSTFAGTAATASSSTNFIVANTLTLDETLTDFAKVNSTIVGTNNLFQQATGSHTSAHGKYTLYKGTNARAGEFVTVWNGTNTTYFDNATTDIGNTSDITFQSLIVTSQIQINTVAVSSGWTVKMLVTYL